MSTKAWGGRFSSEPDPAITLFSRSIGWDLDLWPEDLAGSRAHLAELVESGVLTTDEGKALSDGLTSVERELASGNFTLNSGDEDVHLAIERRLIEQVGPVGGRLHTGRSRNDQVALDLRLRVRRLAHREMTLLTDLMHSLYRRAKQAEEENLLLPGYTHLQRAQPVRLGHHLLAYFEMFDRDRSRLAALAGRADVSPLGAAALAGTPHPLVPARTASRLNFASAFHNSLDAVSDRDFLADYLYFAAVAGSHLSRLADEIVLFTTAEFAFWHLPDRLAAGSSIMPQKKNPEPAEHVRGRAGTLIGVLAGFLATLKGLPLAYVSDLQESHRALSETATILGPMLAAANLLVDGLEFDAEAMSKAAADPSILATDLADRLTQQGTPFRKAHRAVGELIARAATLHVALTALPQEELRRVIPNATTDLLDGLTPKASADARHTPGGTGAPQVLAELASAQSRLTAPALPPLPEGLPPLRHPLLEVNAP